LGFFQPIENVFRLIWPGEFDAGLDAVALFGLRDLKGTVIAWTNHRFSDSGASGKGGGQVSSGEKDFRTFALGLCIGIANRILQIWYDNELIWSGNVGIEQAATVATATVGIGGVVLTDSLQRGTITFYFGVENQTQDPILAQYIPDVPFYRGMCYAVFHGPRNGTRGFRLGNADTLAQIALRVERIPEAPFQLPFSATVQPNAGNVENELQLVTLTADTTDFTGTADIEYSLLARNAPSDSQLNIAWSVASGTDYPTTGTATITNGTPFAVGSLGLMCTLSWGSNAAPVLASVLVDVWNIFLASGAGAVGGANVAAMLYEELISPLHGIALDEVLIDIPAFQTAALALTQMGLSWAVEELSPASQVIEDILKHVQGALSISNGLLGLRLLLGGDVALTLEPDDINGVRQRPGSWYEVPAHADVKYADINRKYHDTILPLPGAGDFGNDEKTVHIELPMVTDAGVARLIGSRLRVLEALPKTPDTLVCGRAAFPLQFGDVILINNALLGYDPTLPMVIVAIREHGVGDESIELDIVPDIFSPLPVITSEVGGTNGGGGAGPATPIDPIVVEELVELPWDFAQDGSKQFTLFAARPDPDIQGMQLFASTENPPVDYNLADSSAPLHAGGTVIDSSLSQFTMDRDAYIDFQQASDDIDLFSSLSDTDWFGYQMLVLVGSGIGAGLYAAKELELLDGEAGTWRLQGLIGPLSDTPVPTLNPGDPLFVFVMQPLFQLDGLPSWVINTLLTFKAIPFGPRPSPTLAQASGAGWTVLSRALRPFPCDSLVANGRGASMCPLYSADIALSWVRRNRGFGLGYETNPSEFDPTIPGEVTTCDVEVWVAGILKRTDTANVRAMVATVVTVARSPFQFDVASVAGLQVGDRISDQQGSAYEYFGRIESISGLTITLFSALAVTPQIGDTVNRYESIGYIYTSADNTADNGSLAAAVAVKVYAKLNGLRSLNPAQITVTQS